MMSFFEFQRVIVTRSRKLFFLILVYLKCQICTLLRKILFFLWLFAFTNKRFDILEKIKISIYTPWNEFHESHYTENKIRLSHFTYLNKSSQYTSIFIVLYKKVLKHSVGKFLSFKKRWKLRCVFIALECFLYKLYKHMANCLQKFL
jgi:hypothetical protein